MHRLRDVIRDICLAAGAGFTAAVLAFLVTVNVVDWFYFRDLPDDATRGITDNIYGAKVGLFIGALTCLLTFVRRTRRRQSDETHTK